LWIILILLKKIVVNLPLITIILFAVIATACDYLQPDKNPPVIQNYQAPEWVVENENIDWKVYASDDRGVEQVYIQFNNGQKTSLEDKSNNKINTGEESIWEANSKLSAGSYDYIIIVKDRSNQITKNGEITVYPNYGISSGDEIKYGLDPGKPHPASKYLLDKNLGIYIPQLKILDNDQTLDQNKKAFINLLPGTDDDANWIIKNKFILWAMQNEFTFEDGEITDLELAILKNPYSQDYIQQLFDQYMSDINKINPELATELSRLDDLKNIQIDSTKKLKALEHVLVLADNPKYKSAFKSMLNEGIKDKRKICTPIEGLFDITEYSANYNPFDNYSLENLIHDFWIYRGDIWEDFDKATDRLNSIDIIAMYARDKIWHQAYVGQKKTPKEVFNSKYGNCIDQSRWEAYCMIKNGATYSTSSNESDSYCILLVHWEMPIAEYSGHAVFLYKKDKLFYFIDDGTIDFYKRIYGPFNTLEDVIKAISSGMGVGIAGYSCSDINSAN
jgi:hypothetical protein